VSFAVTHPHRTKTTGKHFPPGPTSTVYQAAIPPLQGTSDNDGYPVPAPTRALFSSAFLTASSGLDTNDYDSLPLVDLERVHASQSPPVTPLPSYSTTDTVVGGGEEHIRLAYQDWSAHELSPQDVSAGLSGVLQPLPLTSTLTMALHGPISALC
jgi:hypothetical protein